MNKNTLLLVCGFFAANALMAQNDKTDGKTFPPIEGFRLMLLDREPGHPLVPTDCEHSSSALINLDPRNRTIYFDNAQTLEEFAADPAFREHLKTLSPDFMEEHAVSPAENYVPRNGADDPYLVVRMTRSAHWRGWDIGFYRHDLMRAPARTAPPRVAGPLIF